MADADVQGMLIRIEATTAQLRQEMARGDAAVGSAANSMDRNLQRVDDAFDRTGENASVLQKAISSAFTAASLAAGAAVAGLVAITTKTAEYATQVKSLSALSNTSTEQFQRLTAGARSVGIEQEKLADIFKDTTDRVGEFLQRGGGEMADFFKEIAPKVGVTAQMFRDLSGPDALQLFYNSLEKAGLNQQQMTTYMESMADEATSLIPLLRNGGAGFQEFGEKAAKAGNILSDIQLDQFAEIDQTIKTLGSSFDGASRQLANGLLPGIVSVSEHLSAMSDNGAMEVIGAGIGFLAGNLNILVAILGAKVAASFTSYASQVLISTKSTLADALAAKANALAKAEQAAAAAGLAAALAKEASATVVGTRAAEAAAMAKVRVIQAARDQLAYQAAITVGTSEAVRYTRALAATELELAAAKKLAVQASLQLGVVLNAETAALAKDTAATAADAAAKTQLAAASSLAARAGSGLLAILGGPAGIAALAVGVGIAFLTMRDSTKQASLSLDDMKAPLDEVIAKFKTLNEDQRKAALVRWGEAQAAAAKTAAGEFGNLAASIRAATVEPGQARLGRYSVQLQEYTALIDRLKDAQANGQALTPILEGLRGKSGIDNAQIDSWIKQAGAVSDAGVVLKEVTLKLNEQSGALTANTAETTANNAAKTGMSAAGTTYLQTLQKQLDGLEDGGNATKIANRYIAEHAELTGTDKLAILSAAAAIEANKAATQRATAATQSGTNATKEAAAEAEKQTKALSDLKTQADIAISSATGLAAAYLAGTDKSREFSLQQKVEEALLKTGSAARAEVIAKLTAEKNAQDKLAVSKSAYDLGKETADLIAQSQATLMGVDALEAYNAEKAMQIVLAEKNVAVGSKEYEQLKAATALQLDAVKIARQAAGVGSIMDRLYPEQKLLNDYVEGQKSLNAAIALGTEKTPLYQDALAKLGLEYEQNKNAATAWGQFTEGAVDRVDGAFADAWKNIGDGFSGFAKSLKDGFKQLLAELAHMAITKPIIMQIGASLGVGGLSAATAGAGGSGGIGIGSVLNGASSVYSAATGWGKAVYTGYQSGGFSGAASGLGNYAGGLFSGADQAAGQAIGTIANGGSMTYAPLSYQANNGGAAASGASGATTYAPWAAAIGGAIMGYQNSGVKGAVAGAAGGFAGAKGGAALGSYFGPIGTAVGAVIGGILGAVGGSKLFGGDWITKDQGIQLSVNEGDFVGNQFEYQKKKGGLFSSNKKRTRLTSLDPEMQTALDDSYAGTLGTVLGLFDSLNVELNDGVLDGLNMSATKISTKGKTADQIQTELMTWFGKLGDSAVSAVNDATDAGLQGFDLSGLTTFVANLYEVNGIFDKLGVKMVGFTVAGGRAVDYLIGMAGGVEALQANIASYYDAFTSDTQKTTDTLDAVRAQFVQLGMVLPETEAGYKSMLKSLDMTSGYGQVTFSAMTANAKAAAAAYVILNQREDDYYSAFHTESENTARAIAETTAQIKELGVTLPGARDAFRDMVEAAAKDSTASGKSMYDTLMSVAGAAGTVFDALESTAQAAADAAKAVADAAATAAKEAADAAAAAQATYYNLFTSEAQKATDTLASVTEQFKVLGLALPESRDGFVSMVDSIDKTTAAGQSMFDSLMGLATNADSAFKIIQQRSEEAAKAISDALNLGVTSAFSAAQRAIGAQQKAATDAYNATNTSLNDMLSTVTGNISGLTSVGNDLSAALKALRGDSDDAVKMLRAQAQATLQSALATVRAGGSLSGFAGLEDALDTIGNNNTDLYGSLEDFNRDQGRTANVVAELNGINGKQLTAAEKSLRGLEDQIDLAKSAYDLQMSQYDSDLAFAQAQLDALNGIDNSIMGLSAALSAMRSATVAALQVQPPGAAQANTPTNNGSIVDALYQTVLGRNSDADGKAYWTDKLQSGALSYQQIAESLANGALAFDSGSYTGPVSQDALAASKAAAQAYLDSLPKHANGGLISGPGTGTSDSILSRLSNGEYVMSADAVRMFGTGLLDQMNAGRLPSFATGGGVGETGPQLEITGPSRIYSANQTASMLRGGIDFGALLSELKQTREENKSQRFQIAKTNQQVAALLQKWDAEGTPQEREYAL